MQAKKTLDSLNAKYTVWIYIYNIYIYIIFEMKVECLCTYIYRQRETGSREAAAGAAMFFATTTLLTKALTKGEALITILFWLTLMQLGLGLAATLADGQMRLPDATTLPWLSVVGVAGVIAHLCLTKALSLAPAGMVVPLDFVRLPLIAVVGALFYAEPLSLPVFAGGAVILAAIWMNLSADRHVAKGQ